VGTEEPGELDLADVVTRLNRVRIKNRIRLANSELTRAFLDSALALAEEAFGAAFVPEESGPAAACLSRSKVLARTERDRPDLVPTEAKLRDRWTGQQAFLADFVAYALAVRQRAIRDALAAHSLDFPERLVDAVVRLPAFRIQLFAIAVSSGDPAAASAVGRLYGAALSGWAELFERAGLPHRGEASVEDLALCLQATLEGLALQELAGVRPPSSGRAVRALLAAFAEDKRSLTA
jgi:hypothetical protein